VDSADYLRNLSSRKLPILTNNAVGAPGGDATEKALPITPPSVYNGGVPASNEKASEYNKAMALLEAGMFGLSGPNVAAVLVLALVLFGGRKIAGLGGGGPQAPTHPVPGIDPKTPTGMKAPCNDGAVD
jgi:hypothetical protein